jgi:phosphomannomutase/phosphoglucomutase
MVKRSLFGTSGIRGHAEKFFTNQFCFDIGRTFAKFLDKHNQEGGIAIGMDPRGSSPRIKDAIAAGLVYEGREIFDQGATPVPSMCYILKISDYYAGSVMVSGSHIKPTLNGIKFFAFDEEILKNHEKEIEKIYKSIKAKIKYKKAVEYEIHDEDRANEEYMEMLASIADHPYPTWRVVVDPGDGAQSDTMPQVLSRLGVKVIEMNATIQGKFYARDTEHLPDMQDLINRVKKEKADFGVGYDADGDRVIFVDEKGQFIPGDYTACIIAKEMVKDKVVTPISTSQVVDHIGKNVIRTKVGAPYVIARMKQVYADLGFEPNGGCIFPKIMMTRDGGSTTIYLLNTLKTRKKTLSKLISELPKFHSFKDKVDYRWELQEIILNEAKKRFKGVRVDDRDGVKIWTNDTTWILFRSSQNSPEFRVFTESSSKKKSSVLMKEGMSMVKEIVKKSE